MGHDARFLIKGYDGNAVAVTTKLGSMLFQQFIKGFHQSLGLFGPAQIDNIDKLRQHIFGKQKARLKSVGGGFKMSRL